MMWFLLSLIALVLGQGLCDAQFSINQITTLQNTGEINCCGPQSPDGGLFTWRGGFGARCFFKIVSAKIFYEPTTFAYAVKGGRVTSAKWGKGLAIISGRVAAIGSTINATDVVFQFNSSQSDNCDTQIKLEYRCSSSPKIQTILAGRNETYANSSTGFSYYTFPNLATTNGSFFYLSFAVNGYQGLKPPVFYVANAYLPGLDEGADFVVQTTKTTGNKYTAELEIERPLSGNWIIGLYSYGRYTNVAIDTIWEFNFPQLVNEQTESSQITKRNGWSRQVVVPPSARGSILFEYARESPGGQTTFLVGQGFVPELYQFSQKASTTSGDFGEITLTYPFNTSNPGVFIFRAILEDGSAVAGFTVRATWKTQ